MVSSSWTIQDFGDYVGGCFNFQIRVIESQNYKMSLGINKDVTDEIDMRYMKGDSLETCLTERALKVGSTNVLL